VKARPLFRAMAGGLGIYALSSALEDFAIQNARFDGWIRLFGNFVVIYLFLRIAVCGTYGKWNRTGK